MTHKEWAIYFRGLSLFDAIFDDVLSTRTINSLVNAFGRRRSRRFVNKKLSHYDNAWRDAPSLGFTLGKTDEELLLVKNFGTKSLREIQVLRDALILMENSDDSSPVPVLLHGADHDRPPAQG